MAQGTFLINTGIDKTDPEFSINLI